MILIYTHTPSPRLIHVCDFIFKDQFHTPYSLTTHRAEFDLFEGIKINYSSEVFNGQVFNLHPGQFLFETEIKQQQITCFIRGEYKAFFKTENSDYEFDILAASFFLISRYEEWLPHRSDSYGRYAHENALAFKEGFLNLPLVDIWIAEFHRALEEKSGLEIPFQKKFQFVPTYDIDMAWSYKNKGLLRNIGGMIKTKSLSRIAVLLRNKPDPYDSYDFLDQLHRKYNLIPRYFMLLSQVRSEYDKNINPYAHSMWRLMKRLAKNAIMGIHPSWRSFTKSNLVKSEKKILETVIRKRINISRLHYIKFEFPTTFENLIQAGIQEDYSMGYGSINGFRASTAQPVRWYNFKKESTEPLRYHSFCFMDANAHYEQKLSIKDSKKELAHYFQICKQHQLPLITVFHNNFLGTDPEFAGWRELYESFISQIPQ